MDVVQCLKLFNRQYQDICGAVTYVSDELGWKITVNVSVLTTDPDGVWCELVRQIEVRLLVLKAFPCEAADAPEVAADEEPEWDNEHVPSVWNW